MREALGELRRVRQVTQVELSRAMQRPQSTVSRIEREGDMLLSTLAAYVEALGGHLEITAVLDGERIPLTSAPGHSTSRARSEDLQSIREWAKVHGMRRDESEQDHIARSR